MLDGHNLLIQDIAHQHHQKFLDAHQMLESPVTPRVYVFRRKVLFPIALHFCRGERPHRSIQLSREDVRVLFVFSHFSLYLKFEWLQTYCKIF